ncbi:ubiquinol-cytochrome c reductase subunit 8 [Moesziomyces antarcticus]|uniref:Cytochrome b-c1 complex subunit 8 n=3 Tax=Moesziomyces TaxID=63261 RepID=A0A081CNZ5_PSEA2|nr:ubiquinol-cytochrome c reductase subunit 8 [Moesziomyces antarcticus]GAK68391.1 ubiquinol-cytochrome c reductase subunit 8 [Moesziomyces antarcticus]SPO47008.1 probable ubiquinol-cytochrome c reductase complex 11 kda protein [Moesziomyces antarcticus]
MRASQVSFSGMPTGKKYMGWWGDMGGPAQRGIVQYSVSPFQQNAMRGALHSYIFYGFKRIMQQAPYFAVPFAAGYGLIAWAKSKNAYYNSKAGHAELAHDE